MYPCCHMDAISTASERDMGISRHESDGAVRSERRLRSPHTVSRQTATRYWTNQRMNSWPGYRARATAGTFQRDVEGSLGSQSAPVFLDPSADNRNQTLAFQAKMMFLEQWYGASSSTLGFGGFRPASESFTSAASGKTMQLV